MARKNKTDEDITIRKLRSVAGTLVITIPPELAQQLKWTSGNHVAVKKAGNQIIISKVRMEVME